MDVIDNTHEKGYAQPAMAFADLVASSGKDHVVVTREKLQSVAYEVVNLVMLKNADYGDAWQRRGLVGCLARLTDKLCRVETLSDGREALVPGEQLQDTLQDAIGYSLLALLWLEEHGDE